MRWLILILTATLVLTAATPATKPTLPDALRGKGDVFPIAVWLQQPRNAPRYQALGINLYVGLWEGPTATQLTDLQKAGMPVLCAQNPEALKPQWKDTILGWLQPDEPDNAQPLGKGRGYGPPVPPAEVLQRYQALKKADPLGRPVLLNLGQGVAWDAWHGRGPRTGKTEDYPEYVKAADIVGFDIYPVTHDKPAVAGKLEFVGRGVQRLVKWTGNAKPVWACIETTHVSNPKAKPTPDQVRSEVWMAIIHGARGLVYFAHEFEPKFVEAGLLADPQMSAAVATINTQVQSLAGPILTGEPVTVKTDATIAALGRKYQGRTYIFAVEMTGKPRIMAFEVPGVTGPVDVIGEQRTIQSTDGKWADPVGAYGVRLFKTGRGG